MLDRCISLFHAKKYDEAKQLFEEIISQSNDEKLRDESLCNIACCHAASGRFEQATKVWSNIKDQSNDLIYNKALCFYDQSDYESALTQIDTLLENCLQHYPEFYMKDNMNSLFDGASAHPDNLERLEESCLIEALNLKAAIIYRINQDLEEANRCLDELPIKDTNQLDCVSLLNRAIFSHNYHLQESIEKLVYLVTIKRDSDESQLSSLVPEQTYLNALILCLKENDTAKWCKFLEENHESIINSLDEDRLAYFEALLVANQPREIIYQRLDKVLSRVLDRTDKHLPARPRELDLILAIVTKQGEILWDGCHYEAIERLLERVRPIVGHLYAWKVNMAHTLFMQDTRYAECSLIYEELLEEGNPESLLEVNPVVIGNLCVSYVLTARTTDAEALIKDVESDEDSSTHFEASSSAQHLGSLSNNQIPDGSGYVSSSKTKPSHLCILNLIIGTLYCVKFNYSYGMMRIFKALEPMNKRLHPLTWFYAKRCILSLIDCHCKQMICAKDELFHQVIEQLMLCEKHGVLVETLIHNQSQYDNFYGQNSVTYEARYLRRILVSLFHD